MLLHYLFEKSWVIWGKGKSKEWVKIFITSFITSPYLIGVMRKALSVKALGCALPPLPHFQIYPSIYFCEANICH